MSNDSLSRLIIPTEILIQIFSYLPFRDLWLLAHYPATKHLSTTALLRGYDFDLFGPQAFEHILRIKLAELERRCSSASRHSCDHIDQDARRVAKVIAGRFKSRFPLSPGNIYHEKNLQAFGMNLLITDARVVSVTVLATVMESHPITSAIAERLSGFSSHITHFLLSLWSPQFKSRSYKHLLKFLNELPFTLLHDAYTALENSTWHVTYTCWRMLAERVFRKRFKPSKRDWVDCETNDKIRKMVGRAPKASILDICFLAGSLLKMEYLKDLGLLDCMFGRSLSKKVLLGRGGVLAAACVLVLVASTNRSLIVCFPERRRRWRVTLELRLEIVRKDAAEDVVGLLETTKGILETASINISNPIKNFYKLLGPTNATIKTIFEILLPEVKREAKIPKRHGQISNCGCKVEDADG